jgi:hypothetical protein
MTSRQSDTELKVVEADNYSSFGLPIVKSTSDERDVCLPGGFLDKYQLVQLDRCPLLMATKCAENFDEKCELYFSSLVNENEVKDFLGMTLRKKFCRLPDDSPCKMSCQKFDPIAETSSDICQPIGNEVLEDKNMFVDIGLAEAVSISPYFMNRCQLQCDDKKASDIPSNDPLIKKCIDSGVGQDVLNEVCGTSKPEDIVNQDLRSFCQSIIPPQNEKESFGTVEPRSERTNCVKCFLFFLVVVLILVCLYFALKKILKMLKKS